MNFWDIREDPEYWDDLVDDETALEDLDELTNEEELYL